MASLKYYDKTTNQWEYVNFGSESGSSDVLIDNTLTQSGQAADAKVVGDALAEVINSKTTVINIKEKYGIDNTGNIDCSALINQAIADANDRDVLYLPNGTYKLDSTVIVNKSVNLKFEGIMKYTGKDFAFLFKNFNYSKAEFNRIQAPNGSCIKLFSDWSNEKNFIQYSHFIFNVLNAKAKTDTANGGYCFLAESVSGGWINENRFTGGKIESGEYAVYVDCKGHNSFNGNLFDSCGIEGVDVGFYLANNCRNNMIFRCRHSESFGKFLHTVGVCYGLKVISNSPFNVSENVISPGTTGYVIASLPSADGVLCDTKANFVRGTIVCEKHDNTKYLSSEPSGVFDMTNLLGYETEYSNFVVGGLCSGIKLNKKYGYTGGINKFFVKFTNANTKTFTITDCDGNTLAYTIPKTANSVVRFNWFAETGWQCNYEFSNAEQVKELVQLSEYVRSGEAVKSVNNTVPDENGNVEIVVVQEDPIVVGSLAECVDTTKKYVLPDGYIYAYRKRFYPGATTPNFTNQLPISQSPTMDGSVYEGVGYKPNIRLTNDHTNQKFTESAETASDYKTYASGVIPIKLGDVVRVNRIGCHAYQGESNPLFRIVRQNFQYAANLYYQNDKLSGITAGGGKYTVEGSGNSKIVKDIELHINSDTIGWIANAAIGWLVCHFQDTTPPEDIIITVNEEITYTVTEDRYEWSWENTGELYVKPDYIGMMNELVSSHSTSNDAHNDIRSSIGSLNEFVNNHTHIFSVVDDGNGNIVINIGGL